MSEQSRRAELDRIVQQGITADVPALLDSLVSQFADARFYAREVVVNSADAGASRVTVGGADDEDTFTIFYQDDGSGMTLERLRDYWHALRSRKPDDSAGRFGIGSKAVARMANQIGFEVVTSTGEEAWRACTGRLLAGEDIHLDPVVPVPERGTRIAVTFERRGDSSARELERIRKVLYRSVRYLDTRVEVQLDGAEAPLSLNESWDEIPGLFGHRQVIRACGRPVEVTFALGPTASEMYARRIHVHSGYDLLSADIPRRQLRLTGVRVLVDADFDLPFGRHRLRDERQLNELSAAVRRRVLPAFVAGLCRAYRRDALIPGEAEQVERIAVELLRFDPGLVPGPRELPIWRRVDGRSISLTELEQSARDRGAVYLIATPGAADLSHLGATVLGKSELPPNGLALLEARLGARLVRLDRSDSVMEQPSSAGTTLTAAERKLQSMLPFTSGPTSLSQLRAARVARQRRPSAESVVQPGSEARSALQRARSLTWRVGRLVGPDGRTPAIGRRFLLTGAEVVLNAHHPEIARLVGLVSKIGSLAAHWAVAIACGEHYASVLPGLSQQAREELLTLHALQSLDQHESNGGAP